MKICYWLYMYNEKREQYSHTLSHIYSKRGIIRKELRPTYLKFHQVDQNIRNKDLKKNPEREGQETDSKRQEGCGP